eukprot:GILK01012774.1.p1 GENE.GILK01012774.1~~GILK01012774.1.p1  ORF type:complete len:447 (-),score=103.98 GILK01012774.1:199-1539(-)
MNVLGNFYKSTGKPVTFGAIKSFVGTSFDQEALFELEDGNSEVERLKREKEECQKQIDAWKAKYVEQARLAKNLVSFVREHESSKERMIETLKSERANTLDTLSKRTDELHKLEDLYTQFGSNFSALDDACKQLRKECDTLKAERAEALANSVKLQDALNRLQVRHRELESAHVQLTTDIDFVNTELQEVKAKPADQVNVSKMVKQLRTKQESVLTRLQDVRKKHDDVTLEFNDVAARYSESEKIRENGDSAMNGLFNKFIDVTTQSNETKLKKEEAEKEHMSVKNTHRNTILELQGQFKLLDEEADSMERQFLERVQTFEDALSANQEPVQPNSPGLKPSTPSNQLSVQQQNSADSNRQAPPPPPPPSSSNPSANHAAPSSRAVQPAAPQSSMGSAPGAPVPTKPTGSSGTSTGARPSSASASVRPPARAQQQQQHAQQPQQQHK